MPDNSEVWREEHEHEREERQPAVDQLLKFPAFLKLTNTDPFVAWVVVTGDATPDGIRVVRSVMGAIRSPPIVALREQQSCVAKRSRLSRVAEWLRRKALIAGARSMSMNERSIILRVHTVFLMSEVPLFLTSEAPLFLVSEAPLFLMSEVSMFAMSEVPLFLMSEAPLFLMSEAPLFLMSEVPLLS